MSEKITRSRRPRLRMPASARDNRLSYDGLRQAAEADPKRFIALCDELIADGLRWRDVHNLGDMFHALVDVKVETYVEIAGKVRVVSASAFPLLSGGLMVAGINDAAEAYPSVMDELVTDIEDVKDSTTIAGVLSEAKGDYHRTTETEDYPEIGAGEEKFEILARDQGARIAITGKMLEQNNIPDIERRVNALGEIMEEVLEEQGLERITDHHGSKASPAEPYVLRLNGAATSLYTTSANSPGKRAPSGTRLQNNSLVDRTDLEAARKRLAAMTNERGKRVNIPWSEVFILAPDALSGVLDTIIGSELTPGTENEQNPFGPRGRYRTRPEQVITTPKLDDLSTSAWYVGDFKRQFTRKWRLRMELVTLGMDTESFLRTRIAFQARIAWDCEYGATEYNRVVQCLAGTKAPADE